MFISLKDKLRDTDAFDLLVALSIVLISLSFSCFLLSMTALALTGNLK
jgi:hypothetical protein